MLVPITTEGPSPFSTSLPTLQLAWDSTSLSLLQECPRKYQYSMLMQFHAPGLSIHLDFGIRFHSAIECYHRAKAEGKSHDDAVVEGTWYCLRWDDSQYRTDVNYNYKNRHTLARTFVWHCEQYQEDAFEIHILKGGQWDGKPAVELSFKMDLNIEAPGGDSFILCGHLDALGKFQDDYFFMDHKTTKSALSEQYFAGFNPNTQMTNYFAAAKVILNEPARGGIVNAAQLGVNFTRFSRRFVHRTEGQMEEWHDNVTFWLKQAQRFAESGYYPMNTHSCSNYGGCAFRQICSLDPSVRIDFLKGQYERWEWNPLVIRGD